MKLDKGQFDYINLKEDKDLRQWVVVQIFLGLVDAVWSSTKVILAIGKRHQLEDWAEEKYNKLHNN